MRQLLVNFKPGDFVQVTGDVEITTREGYGNKTTTKAGTEIYAHYQRVSIQGFPGKIQTISPMRPSRWIAVEFDFQIQPEPDGCSLALLRRAFLNPDEIEVISPQRYDELMFDRVFPAGAFKP